MTIDASAESCESSADYGFYEFEQFEIEQKQTNQDRRTHAIWKRLRFSLCSMNADGSAGAPEAPDHREWHGYTEGFVDYDKNQRQLSAGGSAQLYNKDWSVQGDASVDTNRNVKAKATVRRTF